MKIQPFKLGKRALIIPLNWAIPMLEMLKKLEQWGNVKETSQGETLQHLEKTYEFLDTGQCGTLDGQHQYEQVFQEQKTKYQENSSLIQENQVVIETDSIKQTILDENFAPNEIQRETQPIEKDKPQNMEDNEIMLENSKNREDLSEQEKEQEVAQYEQREEIKENKAGSNLQLNTEQNDNQIQDKQEEKKTNTEENIQPSNDDDKKILQQDDKDITLTQLNKIFDLTYRERDVPLEFQYFVGEPQNQKELITYYFGIQKRQYKDFINKLLSEISGFQRIRGDGNCFYTAFTYQYLALLLKDQDRRTQFINLISELLISITYQEIRIENGALILTQFLEQFKELESEQQLFETMKNPKGMFYGYAIIVMRNLIVNIYRNDQELFELAGGEHLVNNLLSWEEECNSNEIIIAGLAKHLKLYHISFILQKYQCSLY